MKTAGRILLILLILAIAIPAAFVTLLTTSYSNQTWNLFSQTVDLPLQADNVHYEFPYHLTFQNITTNQKSAPFIEQVDIWLNPDVRRDGKWVVDSLLIDGLSLQRGMPELLGLSDILFHQIALKNIDYADEMFSINGLNLQIQDPNWSSDVQILPHGEIQLSAEQLYWHGEAFNNVLLDVDYKAQNSILYGASFSWRGSDVSGQGEQYPQGWSLVNVTIDKLKINNTQWQSLQAKPWQELPITITHINSLDLLNADIEYGDWHWQNLELSLENATLPLSLWNTTALLSLQADSVRFQQQTAVEPRLNAQLKPGEILLQELSLDWQQGTVQVSGRFEPTHWQVDNATIRGLKWAIQSGDTADWWQATTHQLEQIDIKQLDIERSQIIQLSQQPYWQLSGLNLEGRQLEIKRANHRWGIWNGRLDASVVNASYDQILSSHAAIATQSDDGLWQLTRLFAPLEHGYIEGFGQVTLNTISQPWGLNLNADGIPLKLFHPYLPAPLAMNGFSDLSLDLQGLAGDRNMLAYSLTGTIDANLRDTTLKSSADDSLKAITLSPLHLTAQRGNVSMKPITLSGRALSGKITGEVDLASNSLSGLVYELNDVCGAIRGDLLNAKVSINECANKREQKQPHASEQAKHQSAKPSIIDEDEFKRQQEALNEEIIEEEESAASLDAAEKEITIEKKATNEKGLATK
ncbi:AsmA family protein [Vibrio alfacsensis]|uniref:AsmA family protein n=1 Tax=Vibrio alfacsensis TaxID=1074311 RepID=UPI0040694304